MTAADAIAHARETHSLVNRTRVRPCKGSLKRDATRLAHLREKRARRNDVFETPP